MIHLSRCLHCRASFSRLATGRTGFCSDACRQARKRRQQAGYQATARRKTCLQQCQYCYQLIEVRRYKHNRRKYCDAHCAALQRAFLRVVTGTVPVRFKEQIMEYLEAA